MPRLDNSDSTVLEEVADYSGVTMARYEAKDTLEDMKNGTPGSPVSTTR
jgi:hypothetical protein